LFGLSLERLGLTAAEVMHVAVSAEEDLIPARTCGLRTAILGAGEADLVVTSLDDLLQV
jgi:FMN phosphatase YigB (HAD superfamily)